MLDKIKNILGKRKHVDNPFTKPRVVDKRIEKYSRCSVCGKDTLEESIELVDYDKDLTKYICVSCGEVQYHRNNNL